MIGKGLYMEISKNDYVKWAVPGGWVYGQVSRIIEDDGVSKASVTLGFDNGITSQPIDELEKIEAQEYDSYMTSQSKENKDGDDNMSKANDVTELEAAQAKIAELNASLASKDETIAALTADIEAGKETATATNTDLESTKAELETAQASLKTIEMERAGEVRFNELSGLQALAALGYEDNAETRKTLAEMDENLFANTVKMAKAFVKSTDQTQTDLDKSTDQTSSDLDKSTDQTVTADLDAVVEDKETDEVVLANDSGDNAEILQSCFASALGVTDKD